MQAKKKILGNIVQKDVQGSVKVVTLGTSKSWEFIGLILIELPLGSWSSLLNAFFFFNTHIFSRFIFLSPNIQSWIFTDQSGLGSTTAKLESTMTSKGESSTTALQYVQMLPASLPCMRPVLTAFRSPGKACQHAWAVQGKSWWTWSWQSKGWGWGCIMQWTPRLGLGCHAEKTYIKESGVRLLGKSRYERGELLQQWKTQAEECSNHHKQYTIQSAGVPREKRQLGGQGGEGQGDEGRTKLVVPLMRVFPWPPLHRHVFLSHPLHEQITSWGV